MNRREQTDEQWQKRAPLLPPQKPRTGRTNKDHWLVMDGILWVLRTGAPWREVLARFGPSGTIPSRFHRWRKAGIWDRILAALQERTDRGGNLDWTLHFGDGTKS